MCNKKLSHKYTTANLMKHKKRIHPEVGLDHFSPPDSKESNEPPEGQSRLEQQESNDGYNDQNNADCGPGSSNDNSDGETNPEPKVLRRTSEKSPIWRLFDRIDNTFSKCKFCNRVLSHRSTNSNLLKHLRIKHPDIYVKFKNMKHSVDTLVGQFFPESFDTDVTTTNSGLSTVASTSSIPQQDIQIIIDGNQQSFEYNNTSPYTLPIIYIQDEQNPNNMKIVATGEMFTPNNISESDAEVPATTIVGNTNTTSTASLATNSEQMPTHFLNDSETNVQVQTSSQENTVLGPTTSQNVSECTTSTASNESYNASRFLNLIENDVQISRPPLLNTMSVHTGAPENTAQTYVTSSNMSGMINPVPSTSINTAQLPTTILTINGNTIQIPTHLLSGDSSRLPTNFLSVSSNAFPGTTSFQNAPDAIGDSNAITNDFLLRRLEENNKLMQEMQRTINRQNDVLLRLAESIGGGRERSEEEMLTD